MVKTLLKLLSATLLYTVLFMLANALMPFSQLFKELNSSANPNAVLFMLIVAAYTCFVIYYIIKNTDYSGIKLFVNVSLVMFFVQYFMTQTETLFFENAFALTNSDIILLTIAGLFPLLGASALSVRFFQNKNAAHEKEKINVKGILIKLGIIGVIYLCIYMLFGYFVAWQFEELRIFYTGSAEKLSFAEQLANNVRTTHIIFPLQILRGILFGAAIIPVKNMVRKNKSVFTVSVCLIYLCTAVLLIIPNVLFPDTVRIAHLIETSSSMLLFGIIVANILWKKK